MNSSARLPFNVRSFLERPLLPASVATVGRKGGPVLGSLWFQFVEGRFWFSTRSESFLQSARNGSLMAVMVETFEPPDQIWLLRATGKSGLERHEPSRVEAIYRRYLGPELQNWPTFFRDRLHDKTFELFTVLPERGVVFAFPQFNTKEFRWDSFKECPLV